MTDTTTSAALPDEDAVVVDNATLAKERRENEADGLGDAVFVHCGDGILDKRRRMLQSEVSPEWLARTVAIQERNELCDLSVRDPDQR